MIDPHRMPMPMPSVRIVNVARGPGYAIAGRATKVFIDDVDISRCVDFIKVNSPRKDVVTATIRLVVNSVEFQGGIPFSIPPDTSTALQLLGWTPPAGDIGGKP